MKIEVGKTYKSANGREWLVECKLQHPVISDHPYVVTSRGGFNFVNEAGKVPFGPYSGGYTLLPNKVKKTY